MQYILTQEEYDELRSKQKLDLKLKKAKFQELCTKICDEMPVDWGWGGTSGDPSNRKPWGCIFTVEKKAREEGGYDEWYCDECPVQSICPNDYKRWSK